MARLLVALLALAAGLSLAALTAPAQADEAAGLTPPAPATPVLSTTASGRMTKSYRK